MFVRISYSKQSLYQINPLFFVKILPATSSMDISTCRSKESFITHFVTHFLFAKSWERKIAKYHLVATKNMIHYHSTLSK